MKARKPRSGSMQFWPRKRAKKQTPRIRSWPEVKDASFMAFAGYKAGMTHIKALDTRKNSTSKGQSVSIPVTVIECPPMRIYSVRFYAPKKDGYGSGVAKEIVLSDVKELSRKISAPKKKLSVSLDGVDLSLYSDVTVLAHTAPKSIGLKKTPDIFELALGGSKDDKFAFVKEHVGKDIAIGDVFKEGDFADAHAITKGKGFQGPVKRFGIGLKSHKSEKGRRAPGSLGGWKGHAHFMYRVAHAGQTGYHQRVQFNNHVLHIGEEAAKVNPLGGFVNYGLVSGKYLLLRGSIPGPKKRLVVLTKPRRLKVNLPLPTLQAISTHSQQGR